MLGQSTQLKNRLIDSYGAYKRKQFSDLEELAKKEQEIERDELELRKPMEQRVKEWLLDFMNLVFGSSEESRSFWDEVLLPEASVYYDFDLPQLLKFEPNLNALYYALVEHLNLRITEREAMTDVASEEQQQLRTKITAVSQQTFLAHGGALSKP